MARSKASQKANRARHKLNLATTRNPNLIAEEARSRSRKGSKPIHTKFEDWQEVNPLLSPYRIMRTWTDDAIRAVWKSSSTDIGIPVYLEFRRANQLSPAELDHCVDIVQYTSGADYKSSSIGWNLGSKVKEMSDTNMMYILVRSYNETFAPDLPTNIVGFMSFKIDKDDPPYAHRDVIYIFEVHIGEKFRGKGLAKFLVFTAEAMGAMVSITKTMLTVFTSNTGAIKAYKKLGYVKDQSSPADRQIRDRLFKADYMIMSKWWPLPGRPWGRA